MFRSLKQKGFGGDHDVFLLGMSLLEDLKYFWLLELLLMICLLSSLKL